MDANHERPARRATADPGVVLPVRRSCPGLGAASDVLRLLRRVVDRRADAQRRRGRLGVDGPLDEDDNARPGGERADPAGRDDPRAGRRDGGLAAAATLIAIVAGLSSATGVFSRVGGAPVAAPREAAIVTTAAYADDAAVGEFTRFALNALLATLLDDDEPPRWSDVALGHVCGPGTRVEVDGRPLLHGTTIPATTFTVRWQMDRCSPLEAFEVSGTVGLLVFHEDDGLGAIVRPGALSVSSAKGTRSLRAPFAAALSLLQSGRP